MVSIGVVVLFLGFRRGLAFFLEFGRGRGRDFRVLRSFFGVFFRVLENEDFLKSVSVLVKKVKCKLIVCFEEEN